MKTEKLIEYYATYFRCDVDGKRVRGGFSIKLSKHTGCLSFNICKKHGRKLVQGLQREFNITPYIKKP